MDVVRPEDVEFLDQARQQEVIEREHEIQRLEAQYPQLFANLATYEEREERAHQIEEAVSILRSQSPELFARGDHADETAAIRTHHVERRVKAAEAQRWLDTALATRYRQSPAATDCGLEL
jgi:hypothetical protein